MIATALLWAMLLLPAPGQDADPAAEAEPETAEIVVRGVRGRRQCRVELDDRELSERDLDARAREWARGTPVRVRAAAEADIPCLSKIAFRLADKGVRLIEFVDPSGEPARFPPSAAAIASPRPAAAEPGIGERERRFAARRAAKLILDGKCAEARQLMLEAGDLEGAANVVTICRAQ